MDKGFFFNLRHSNNILDSCIEVMQCWMMGFGGFYFVEFLIV